MRWVTVLAMLGIATHAHAITNGVADAGDPAVVEIAGCTGTLISPRVVLTAAHCVIGQDPSALSVLVGANVSAPDRELIVIEARAHRLYDRAGDANDIALVLLAQPIGNIAPLPLRRVPIDDALLGMQARIVGYGMSDPADSTTAGQKREGMTGISQVLATTFVDDSTPTGTCQGDSGGPALIASAGMELVAGVTSRGDCTSFGVQTRVDAYLADFIDPYLAATAPGGTSVGGSCASSLQCASGSTCTTATDDPSVHYCASACSSDADCPSAMRCNQSQCWYPAPSPGAVGAPCSADGDCAAGLCETERPGGPSVCTVLCVVTASVPCARGFECASSIRDPSMSVCLPRPMSSSGGCSIAMGSSGVAPLTVLALWFYLTTKRRRKK